MRASDHADSYPPYNIENTDENNYWVSIAVAGFSGADLEVAAKKNMLGHKKLKTAVNTCIAVSRDVLSNANSNWLLTSALLVRT